MSSSHLDFEWLLSTLFDASLFDSQSRATAALFLSAFGGSHPQVIHN